ncbi:MAG TPA: coniferyl aldehyde dehydrogenase [Dokdonella sp.]|jgi:coniferyl-aldehyde dehydrogenase|uniref:coniferyl aldehyde dehydrogenase n=2 Tax=Dokdonella sp. TaxID=2291710 RepID=UPI002C1BD2EB|nr:coniferyl aldehyde dehydrogenase [Dokdonella sp.]HNV08995.1 coniferyl aldehyde dehydrogenase [Dokdonella sp.]HPW04668.1 coniferyl aldehyde dehydrogenase [Dokdonella sp.]
METKPTIDLSALLERQRKAWSANPPDRAQRMADMAALREAVVRRMPDLVAAMQADFGHRSRHESLISDGVIVLQEIDHVRKHLRRWMRPKRRFADWLFWPARTELQYRAVGVVGIISPWNYPVNLGLVPLVTAIAAGNHVMLKPSEYTPHTSRALTELFAEVFPPERVSVVEGGAELAARFAALPFDHLFFTGSTAVGRKVMAAAAPNLTPLTLELGGKSPAIIAADYPIETAAARIAAGKFFNAGQTCIAPDYVLVPRAKRDALVDALRQCVERSYPDFSQNQDFTSIINEGHFNRLRGLVDEARAAGARIISLPNDAAHDPARRRFAPTLVLDAPLDSRLMQEEIFGPVLPLVPYDTLDQALQLIAALPRPLALYHFDHDRKRTRRVIAAQLAGGVNVNDCLLQFGQTHLPFGGIGPSGMGQYHGHAGFLAMSKQLPIMYQSRWPSWALMRPPYGKLAERLIGWLVR